MLSHILTLLACKEIRKQIGLSIETIQAKMVPLQSRKVLTE